MTDGRAVIMPDTSIYRMKLNADVMCFDLDLMDGKQIGQLSKYERIGRLAGPVRMVRNEGGDWRAEIGDETYSAQQVVAGDIPSVEMLTDEDSVWRAVTFRPEKG